MEHLLEAMEMVQSACEELLVDDIVPTRHHVIVLVIPGFLLVQSEDQKKINCMQEVLNQGTILHQRDYFRTNRLQKVLMEHLFPVGLVMTKEYISKLGKADNIIQVPFFQRTDEL